uniref:BRCT domain-containing protein n=1 Tax=Caenorhabditis japonica TaxID=281687 RepID=A0A8R1ER31_CAEJA
SIVEQNQEHVEELNRRYAMHPHFLVSTSELDPNTSARLLESIKNLGGIVDRDFNTDTYIFITVKLSRTPKNLSIIAAGRWCLTPDYVFKSAAAGHWLDERPFEWTLEKLQEGASEIERRLAVACSMWRNHVANMPITHSVCT